MHDMYIDTSFYVPHRLSSGNPEGHCSQNNRIYSLPCLELHQTDASIPEVVDRCKPVHYKDKGTAGTRTGDDGVEFRVIYPFDQKSNRNFGRTIYLGGRYGPKAEINIIAIFPAEFRDDIKYVKMKRNGKVIRIERKAPYSFFGDKKRPNGTCKYSFWKGVCQGTSYFEAIAYDKNNHELTRAGRSVYLYQE